MATKDELAETVARHMEGLSQILGDAKLTLVVRSPKLEEPCMLSNDTQEVTAAIRQALSTVCPPMVN